MSFDRVLIWAILLGSVLSAGVAFYKFQIAHDYLVFANVSCNPDVESCFIGDGENTPQYYKEIAKKAYTLPKCDGWNDQCPELTCNEGEECEVTYCDPEAEDICYGPTSTE